jgi:capsular polysaccharide biosynthesis protein
MKIKKILQNLFKFTAYRIFFIIYGKIKGKILASKNDKIKILKVVKEKKIKYNLFKIKKARLYTDRIQDTAIILDNYIVEGPSHQLRPVNNDIIENNIVFRKGTPRLKKKINGTTLSLLTGGAGNTNYAHWLFDVLPRIAICEEHVKITEIDFFLFPSTEKKFQRETIEGLEINPNKCKSSEIYRHVLCSNLIVTDHPYCINNDSTKDIMHIPQWISQWLKKSFQKYLIQDKNLPKKFFIDRSDSEADNQRLRKILNEFEVKEFLKREGFKIIKLGNISFEEQVKLFFNAKVVVGLHGAGFANIPFCKPGTKVIEFKNSEEVKQYENLAKKNDLNYNCIVSKPASLISNNQQGHIHISLNKIKGILYEK